MTINETANFLQICDLSNKSPLIEGLHGTGKSEIIRQYAAEHNLHCETLILSLMDVGDLIGLPRTIEVGGTLTTAWASPDWFQRVVNAAFPPVVNSDDLVWNDPAFKSFAVPRLSSTVDRTVLNAIYCEYVGQANDSLYIHTQSLVSYAKAKRSIVFLDEFNRAPVDILNASLQLVLDKRLHSHMLPVVGGKPTFVVAAINPADANYTVNTFDPALLDRFISTKVEADAKAWLDNYARPKGIAPVIRDFIAEHPNRIHFMPADGGVGATPRSWAALSDLISNFDKVPVEVHFQAIKGCIGTEVGSQFYSYFNNYTNVVKLEDIEKAITSRIKKDKDSSVESLGEVVSKMIDKQEALQKQELAENFYQKYITSKSAKAATPMLAYLYGLDLEILNGFLKTKRNDDVQNYLKLAEFDNELNQKGLFKRVTTKLATK